MKNLLVEEILLNKIFLLHDKELNYLILFRLSIEKLSREMYYLSLGYKNKIYVLTLK